MTVFGSGIAYRLERIKARFISVGDLLLSDGELLEITHVREPKAPAVVMDVRWRNVMISSNATGVRYMGQDAEIDVWIAVDPHNVCVRLGHDIGRSASHCDRCDAELCELCGTDEHTASTGHDLSNPMYWGV